MSFCQTCGAAFAGGTTSCPTCTVQPKASTGLGANAAAALAYLAGIVTGILFLVIEPSKSDRFVRFHAFQSIFFNVAWIALWIAWMIVGLVLGAVTKGLFFILQVPIEPAADGGGLCTVGLSDVQRLSRESDASAGDRRARSQTSRTITTAVTFRRFSMKTLWPALLAGTLLLPGFAFADVSYQETTQITGGSMMGMAKMAGMFSSQAKQALAPTTSHVMIHGGRMMRSDPHATEIIDLDAQTITMIDHDKRSYSVMTFQQMEQAMADAAAKVKTSQPSAANGSQMTVDAHITSTGATRELNGETAHETLLTITMIANTGDAAAKGGMAATSEMWLIDDAPGMAEMRSFNQRMAEGTGDGYECLRHERVARRTARGSASNGGAPQRICKGEWRPARTAGDTGRHDAGWPTIARAVGQTAAAKPEPESWLSRRGCR